MSRPCPVCGNMLYEKIRSIHMILPQNIPLPDQYDIVSCKRCGFCYANTSARQTDYDVYYSVYNTYSGATDKALPRVFESIREFVVENVSSYDRILDIGFGKGKLLLYLQELGYNSLTGVDPSQHSVDRVCAMGIEAYRKSVYDEPGALTGCFDLVFLTSVLEHLLYPKVAIMRASSYLKNNGYLIIDVPDYAQCCKVNLPIPNQFNQEHINYFSENSFMSLISTADFQMLYSKSIELKTTSNRGLEYSKMFVLQKSVQGNRPISIRKDLQTKDSIECYLFRQEAQQEKMTNTIGELCAKQTPLLVWGSGALAMSLFASTDLQKCNIAAFVDGNPLKVGNIIYDRVILAPEEVKNYPDATILICAMQYSLEIKSRIAELGLKNRVISLV